MTTSDCRGNALTEYGLILGLVVLLGAAGLQVTGGSVSSLLGGFDQNETTIAKMMSLNFGSGNTASSSSGNPSGSVSLSGSGYYTFVTDPTTGMPTLMMTDSNSGAVSNATSVDGNQWNILGGMRLAGSLEQLASAQTDPGVSQYLQQLATLGYYLAGAEGELDGVPGLERDDDEYGNLDAFRDIEKYMSEMKSLMTNPPEGMSPETYQQTMPLAADAYNIAQAYYQHLKPVVAKNPDQNFSLPSNDRGFGEGRPNQVLDTPVSEITYQAGVSASGGSFSEVMSLHELKKTSTQILEDNKVTSEPVVSTLKDATQLDQASTTMAAP
jgi:Flp pilus assembly pilin Flp